MEEQCALWRMELQHEALRNMRKMLCGNAMLILNPLRHGKKYTVIHQKNIDKNIYVTIQTHIFQWVSDNVFLLNVFKDLTQIAPEGMLFLQTFVPKNIKIDSTLNLCH